MRNLHSTLGRFCTFLVLSLLSFSVYGQDIEIRANGNQTEFCPDEEIVFTCDCSYGTNSPCSGETYVWFLIQNGDSIRLDTLSPSPFSIDDDELTLSPGNSNLDGADIVCRVTGPGIDGSDAAELDFHPGISLSLSPSSLAICQGETSPQVTVTPGGGDGNFSYLWESDDDLIDGDDDESTVTVKTTLSTGTYQLYITVSDGNGCSAKDSLAVLIRERPDADAGNNQAICPGESVVIGQTNNSSYTYLWTPAEGLNDASIALPTAAPSSTTTYTLTTALGGCTNTDNVEVEVIALPTVDEVDLDSPTGCDETDGTITVSASGESGFTLVYALVLAGDTIVDFSSDNSFDNLGKGTYEVLVGYEETVGRCLVSENVVLSPLITLSNIPDYCQADSSIQLADFLQGCESIQWLPMANTDGTLSLSTPGDITVDFICTTVDNCEAEGSLEVTINPLPVITYSTLDSSQDLRVCLLDGDRIEEHVVIEGPNLRWEILRQSGVESLPASGNGSPENLTISTEDTLFGGTVVFQLTASDQACDRIDTLIVEILPTEFFVPDLFTPNGDGINDTWNLKLPESTQAPYTLRIFNRSGATLVEASNLEREYRWDGTLNGRACPDGVYWYVLQKEGEVDPIRGTLTIRR
ncbi:MAG: T9SS type B sorting domain-containing protein [Bacteroidota bacterium]